jgi:hypothetical protein
MQLATDHHLLETLRFELSQCRIYSRARTLKIARQGSMPDNGIKQFHRIVHNDQH